MCVWFNTKKTRRYSELDELTGYSVWPNVLSGAHTCITFCVFIDLFDRVSFFASTRVPGTQFLSYCWFTINKVVFFRAKQPLITVAWRATSLKLVPLKSSSFNRGQHLSLQVPLALLLKKVGSKSDLETSNANDHHSLALLIHYNVHCLIVTI